MAEAPKPTELETAAALVTGAPVTTVLVAAAILAAGWLVGRFFRKERIETLKERITAHKEDIGRAAEKLAWHKTQSDTNIEVLKQANQALNDQIKKGEPDAEKIRAAVLLALPAATKEVLAEIKNSGYFRVNAEPQSEREALVSGSANALADQGLVTVAREGDGRFYIFSPTGMVTGRTVAGKMITDEPKKKP